MGAGNEAEPRLYTLAYRSLGMPLIDENHQRFSGQSPTGSDEKVLVLGVANRKGHLPLERDGEYELRSTVPALAGRRVRASIEDSIMRKVMMKKVNSERNEEAISTKYRAPMVGEEEQ